VDLNQYLLRSARPNPEPEIVLFHLMKESSSRYSRMCIPSAASSGWERVVVLSNRPPFWYERDANGAAVIKQSASGLVTALAPLVEACSGTWVAHRTGNADAPPGAQEALGGARVNPLYRLRYVRLSDEQYRGYYCGFANEALWPLCHAVHVEPRFRPSDFNMYKAANARFAAAVCDEAGDRPALLLVQDYHFALAPGMLRRRLPSSTIVTFWHIPWPDPRVLRTCPWTDELLRGLLGSDIIGFQTSLDRHNFIESVASVPGARIDRIHSRVHHQARSTVVGAYPVGIRWANDIVKATPPARVCREQVFRDLQLEPGTSLCIGIDRLDYTKGINEKLQVVERLLELHPELRERFVLVQVAEPSREQLSAYRDERETIVATSQRVNVRFGTRTYHPVKLLERHHEPADVYRLFRAADVCYVGSLRDGMNLVAKEFVCARDDERGVLVLSQFAGAAQQLNAALIVNPYTTGECAAVLARALALPEADQAERMRSLRANVAALDATWWAQQLLLDAASQSRRATKPTGEWKAQPGWRTATEEATVSHW
jgi:trehalose 6-phosphate synthase